MRWSGQASLGRDIGAEMPTEREPPCGSGEGCIRRTWAKAHMVHFSNWREASRVEWTRGCRAEVRAHRAPCVRMRVRVRERENTRACVPTRECFFSWRVTSNFHHLPSGVSEAEL